MKKSSVFHISTAVLLCILGPSTLRAQDVIEPTGVQAVAMHFASWYRNAEDIAMGGAAFPCAYGNKGWGGAGLSLIAPGNSGLKFTGFTLDAGVVLNPGLALRLDYMGESGPLFDDALQEKHRSVSFGAIFSKGIFQLDGSLRVLQQNFRSDTPWTGALAAGLGAVISKGAFRARLAVENLGFTKVQTESGESFPIPSDALAALGYTLGAGEFVLEGRLAARAFFYGEYGLGGGAALSWKQAVFLRAGFNKGSDSPVPDFLSLGLGAKAGNMVLDAACIFGEGLADKSIFISAKYSF